ncbi:MAG TPA: MmgE/PrpD family protein [Armatimonadetes bacterium]|jgi:2-methylcitrate dehydratase PrpD|nr:MmgE/PrpD family protein [Armatimonadota bacterium]
MDFDNTILCKLGKFFATVTPETLPPQVMAKSRRVLADFLVALAVGYQEGSVAYAANEYFADLGGKPEATALGLDRKLPAVNAALLMGTMAHSIELDDGHRWGTSHPAVSVVPVALAIAERDGKSFPELLTAIAVGYDGMLRPARSVNPQHLDRGFHSTGTCGSLGAAAAAANLLGLGPTEIAYAISLGGLQSAGLCEMLHDQPGIKTIQPGKAAQAGVLAADLVARGVTSPRTLMEGRHGWLSAMCDNVYSLSGIIGELGERWEIMYNYIKLYPTCRHCHATIDLAREARQALQPDLNEIESISVRLYRVGYVEVALVKHPTTFEEAMFSLPFAVAIALKTGNVTLQDYTPENLADEQLYSIAEMVDVQIDEEMNAVYPEERGSKFRMKMRDGREFHKSVPVAKGEPETPVSDEELMAKHEAMLRPYYAPEFVTGLWDIVVNRKLDSVNYSDVVEHFGRFHTPCRRETSAS